VPLGAGLPEIVVLRPVDQEELIRRALDHEDEALPDRGTPYFAELWPAALPLARWMIGSAVGRDERVLELGCGLGLVGFALAKVLGARVTLTDGSPEALELVRRAARLNAPYAHEPVVERLDWREARVAERFPLVVGADVLYAPEAFPWLARAARAAVSPGGSVLLAEPQRPVARSATGFLEAEGLVLARSAVAENGVLVQEWRAQ
jgi:predicted nicotinamide N-methyase